MIASNTGFSIGREQALIGSECPAFLDISPLKRYNLPACRPGPLAQLAEQLTLNQVEGVSKGSRGGKGVHYVQILGEKQNALSIISKVSTLFAPKLHPKLTLLIPERRLDSEDLPQYPSNIIAMHISKSTTT